MREVFGTRRRQLQWPLDVANKRRPHRARQDNVEDMEDEANAEQHPEQPGQMSDPEIIAVASETEGGEQIEEQLGASGTEIIAIDSDGSVQADHRAEHPGVVKRRRRWDLSQLPAHIVRVETAMSPSSAAPSSLGKMKEASSARKVLFWAQ
eukprot:5963629-Amphidinium_carterae.1